MGLLDEFGNDLSKGPGVKQGLDRRIDVNADVFEGIVQVKIFQDAIEGKGKCAHCNGLVEGALKFPDGYLSTSADREERQQDAKKQLYAKFKRDHQCGSRLHKNKIDVDVFLKRFE